MNILMVTNTYLPHVGGVAGSVERFRQEYMALGHRVLVVAPTFENMEENEEGVVRMPAIQNFNGSDFSVRVPVPGILGAPLDEFQPEVVHAHHPYLMGDTAQRIAAARNLPLVFTHHTMYELYTHYVPASAKGLARFVKVLATGYANLCDHVIAPSESTAAILKRRGVETPVAIVPTGLDIGRYAKGDGRSFREARGIPPKAFVVGHVGRLAPEKNLGYLARAVARFLRGTPGARFLVVGGGPSEKEVLDLFERRRVGDRVHFEGSLQGQDLVDAYHAMDVFAFASKSETQGMVLTEAMAAGVPVVALDAPGVREVVLDQRNGRRIEKQGVIPFADALLWVARLPAHRRRAVSVAARRTASRFSLRDCAQESLAVYERVVANRRPHRPDEEGSWAGTLRLLEAEWALWKNVAAAATTALFPQAAAAETEG
jgi:glycosyltransferase involved in cell wall biosynthesis